jgi:hypothetical protein
MKFLLKLHSVWWDCPPTVTIKIDDQIHYHGVVTATKDQPQTIEFVHNNAQDGRHCLEIILSGKEDSQTIVKDGQIIKDQLLGIDQIEINDIDLGMLLFKGRYCPIYPEAWKAEQQRLGNTLPEHLEFINLMGYNGTWSLEFTAPFHVWYLENLP